MSREDTYCLRAASIAVEFLTVAVAVAAAALALALALGFTEERKRELKPLSLGIWEPRRV